MNLPSLAGYCVARCNRTKPQVGMKNKDMISLLINLSHYWRFKQLQLYRAAAWIGYYRLLPDIIGYFPYSFKTHELPGGKNAWKYCTFFFSISLSHQGPARKPKLIEQGVTIFTKLNDLNAEKIPAQRWLEPQATCSLGTCHGSHTLIVMEFLSAFYYT